MHRHIVVLLLAFVLPISAQNATVQKPQTSRPPSSAASQRKGPIAQSQAIVPKSPDAIVNFLLPDGVAYPERLSQVSAADAVAALTQAQTDATGTRADAVAFLLMVLGHEKDANRALLTNSLRSCMRDPDNCDDRTISYAGNLFQRGDELILNPLLEAATVPALAESLSSTYGDMIASDTPKFITGVSRRPENDQRRICKMVAFGDGVGLPDESAADIESALQELAKGVGAVSRTAMMCLSDIRAFAAK